VCSSDLWYRGFTGKIDGSEVVFMGYGIADPNFNYDNYKGLDVKGKTVICISGIPKKEDNPHYLVSIPSWASSKTKKQVAISKGASGFILLQSNKWIKKISSLATKAEKSEMDSLASQDINAAWVDSLFAKIIFNKTDLKYSDLLVELATTKPTALSKTISWNLKADKKIVDARNVVGIVEGSDPSLAKQLVTVGAHYDHIGITNGKVNNGADDNASGTSAILESARQVSANKNNKRPIVYIFHSGEEKGKLGSHDFASRFKRFDDIIVNINMDMVGRESEDSIYVLGSGRLSSEFFDLVEQANKETVNFNFDYELDTPNHPEHFYTRSDHWAYASKGIPVVFLYDWHKVDYHKPTDTAEKINF